MIDFYFSEFKEKRTEWTETPNTEMEVATVFLIRLRWNLGDI